MVSAGRRLLNASVTWARMRRGANRLSAWRQRYAKHAQERVARAPFPFVVGVPRSGTTLLRIMLDAHPDLAVPPETYFITASHALGRGDRARRRFLARVTSRPSWPDFHIDPQQLERALGELEPFTIAEGLRCFYGMYAARYGKSRFADKTPVYHDRMPLISALLPEARFVHIIRDGRDVALSWRKSWFAPSQNISVFARLWQHGVRTAREDSTRVPHYLEVRFEDLIEHTERELRRICAFLELPFADAMLRYYEGSSKRIEEHEARYDRHGALVIDKAGRQRRAARLTQPPDRSRVRGWRAEMTPSDRARFEEVAHRLLSELGYHA
jgi:hypothetical protein